MGGTTKRPGLGAAPEVVRDGDAVGEGSIRDEPHAGERTGEAAFIETSAHVVGSRKGRPRGTMAEATDTVERSVDAVVRSDVDGVAACFSDGAAVLLDGVTTVAACRVVDAHHPTRQQPPVLCNACRAPRPSNCQRATRGLVIILRCLLLPKEDIRGDVR